MSTTNLLRIGAVAIIAYYLLGEVGLILAGCLLILKHKN